MQFFLVISLTIVKFAENYTKYIISRTSFKNRSGGYDYIRDFGGGSNVTALGLQGGKPRRGFLIVSGKL